MMKRGDNIMNQSNIHTSSNNMQKHTDQHRSRPDRAIEQMQSAMRLWPDPDEAPEVPPEATLQTYLNAPDLLESDIRAQIKKSIQCQRALEYIRLKPLDDEDTSWINASLLQDLKAKLASKTPNEPMPTKHIPAFIHRQFGQIWKTRSEVEYWNGSRMAHRFTFRPPQVILLSNPIDLPWDDTIYRAAVVTPAECWTADRMADDEITITIPDIGDYVVHLWLSYPVSGCQISDFIGTPDGNSETRLQIALAAREEGLPLAPKDGAGLPLDPVADQDTFLERERLLDCASWLPATADARREWAESSMNTDCLPERTSIPFSFSQQEKFALAACSVQETGYRTEHKAYKIVGSSLTLNVSAREDAADCDFVIYDINRTPSSLLDGAVVTTANFVSEPFMNGETTVPLQALAGGFRLRKQDGSYVELHEI